MDCYFDSNIAKVSFQSVLLWLALAAAAGIITFSLYRRRKLRASKAIAVPVLVFYLSFVLTITLIERIPSPEPEYELVPFWSYKAIASGTTKLIAENFWNVVLFIPIGVIVSVLFPKQKLWPAIAAGLLLSAAVELTQLITHRGLFEFDDIFHNTLGAVIGSALFLLVKKREE